MPGYTLLNDDDWRRLTERVEEALEERDFRIAWSVEKKASRKVPPWMNWRRSMDFEHG
jgi:hypothetical protein